MTYNDLFLLLKNMHEIKHSCMDQEVLFCDGVDRYNIDLLESLVTGEVCFTYGYGPQED